MDNTFYLKLVDIINKYIEIHQLTANINLFDFMPLEKNCKFSTKCVSNHFLLEGLPDKAKNADPSNDACYYCKLHISKKFSDFDSRKNQCEYCYDFFIDKYNKNEGELKLLKKNKTRKKNVSLF